jgi:hypothetical protein
MVNSLFSPLINSTNLCRLSHRLSVEIPLSRNSTKAANTLLCTYPRSALLGSIGCEFQINLPLFELAPEEKLSTVDEFYQPRLFAKLKQNYSDRRNTFTWALFIWSFTAVTFAIFMPFEATLLRSVAVAGAWSAIHLYRRA